MQNYLNSSFGCILQFLSRKVNIYSSALFFLFLQIRTVKVSNISLAVTERDIKEFFSFSGDIQYVEMQRLALFSLKLPGNLLINLFEEVILKKVSGIFCREAEKTQLAYVTFKNSQGADTAVLLTVGSLLCELLWLVYLFLIFWWVSHLYVNVSAKKKIVWWKSFLNSSKEHFPIFWRKEQLQNEKIANIFGLIIIYKIKKLKP